MSEQTVAQTIKEIQDAVGSLNVAIRKLPRQDAFGVSEILHAARLAHRYISKLEDEWVCNDCGEDFGNRPTVPYYKTRLHHDCYRKRFGQEHLDRAIKTYQEHLDFMKTYREEQDSGKETS